MRWSECYSVRAHRFTTEARRHGGKFDFDAANVVVTGMLAFGVYLPRQRRAKELIPYAEVNLVSDYPLEVEAFHTALRRLTAVESVGTGLKDLAQCAPKTYSWPGEFGDLPHALLRRTNGGLPGEAWAYTELTLARNEAGWIALEFLAWWVRDLSRAGDLIQLRPMALPPKGFEVQLGRTLKFLMDHFAICPTDPSPMLQLLAARAENLSSMMDHYSCELGTALRRPSVL